MCRLARFTVVPASSTGSSSATGVSLPVLPTCTVIAVSRVTACSASYLKAIIQRGLLLRAQPLALVQVVDLHDQAVGLVVERVAQVAPLSGVLDHLVDRVVSGRVGADGDAPFLDHASQGVIRGLVDPPVLAQPVRDEPQPALAAELGSSSLSEPAVEFRGLAKGVSPAARSSLSRTSSEFVM